MNDDHNEGAARRFPGRGFVSATVGGAAGMTASVFVAAPGALADAMTAAPSDTIFQIVGHADPIVKFVMGTLLLASMATWALWFAKSRELRQAKRALKQDITVLNGAATLTVADGVSYHATAEMIQLAAIELARAGPAPSRRALEGVEERVAVQLQIAEAHAIHRVLWGTNLLASIGSISPFIGLAGTVWGIMNSFLGISRSHSTSLAVVAPGIAEALMATAVGLAAAIPAVLIYNSLARAIAGYRRLLSEVAVLTACVLSREIERRVDDDGLPAQAEARHRAHGEAVVSLAHLASDKGSL
jgi:biopolymer transport protein ExbB